MYRLKKSLYELKKAPQEWYNTIFSYLLSNEFTRNIGEPTFYIKDIDGKVLIVVLYLADLIFMGNDNFIIATFKESMKR